jgi:hypothetical protein
MHNLIEQVVNCYIKYLNNLSYGITTQDYKLLYGAILALKNNIKDEKYLEYFKNNLCCPITLRLENV